MSTISRVTLTDDSGGGVDGTVINNAVLQNVYNSIEADIKSANFPNVTTKSVQDNMLAGEVKHLGGLASSAITLTAYPSGTGLDKCHVGTSWWSVDAAHLVGEYRLEGMLQAGAAATVTAALVNLTDGSPDTALVTIASTTAERVRSSVITFPAGGAAKVYGIKVKTTASSSFAWGLCIVRTA